MLYCEKDFDAKTMEFVGIFIKNIAALNDVTPESWTQLSGFSCIRNTQKMNGLPL